MAKMFFYTQNYENYGTPQNPYWKAKGGSDFIIDADAWTEEMIQQVVDSVEFKYEMLESFLIGYQLVHDSFVTDFEQSQMEYEGKITYPATRLSYNEFVKEYA